MRSDMPHALRTCASASPKREVSGHDNAALTGRQAVNEGVSSTFFQTSTEVRMCALLFAVVHGSALKSCDLVPIPRALDRPTRSAPCGPLLALVPTSTSSAPARPAAPAPRRAHGRACRPRGATAARLTHPAHRPARSAPLQAAGAGRRPPAPGGRPSTSSAPARPAAPAPRRAHGRACRPRGATAARLTHQRTGRPDRRPCRLLALVPTSTSSAPARPAAPAPQPAHGRACRPRGTAAARLTHPAHHPARSAPLRAAGAGADLDQLGADPAGSASPLACPRPGLPAPWCRRSQADAPSAPPGTIGAPAGCWRWAPACSTRSQALDLAQLGTGQQRPGRHALDRLGTGPPAAPAPRRAHGRACRPRGATAARLTHPEHRPARSAPLRPAAGAGADLDQLGADPAGSASPSACPRPGLPAPWRRRSQADAPAHHPARSAPLRAAGAGRRPPAPGGRPSTSTSPAPARPAAPAPQRAHGRACRGRASVVFYPRTVRRLPPYSARREGRPHPACTL